MSNTASIRFGAVLLVSLQASFLQPYIILVHGERVNLFTTLLTGLALAVILGLHFTKRSDTTLFPSRWEPWIWGALGLTLMLSAWQSLERTPSIYRSISFLVPALAGYLCGRSMADSDGWNRWVVPLFTVLFLIMSIGQIIYGFGPVFFNVHHHAMANMLLILAAGPFTLFERARSWKMKALAAGILTLGFIAAYLIGSRFVILLPFVLLPILGAFRIFRPSLLLATGVFFILAAVAFFHTMPEKVFQKYNYESVFYRLEGIPASLHIVKKAPLLGIGFRASREPYLADYKIQLNLAIKKTYMAVAQRNVTADNMLTTMAVGAGLLPTTLYFILLIAYCRRVFRSRRNKRERGLANSAIGLSVACCLIHFVVHDGLLYPQLSWFFHILLGLAPLDPTAEV